VSRLDNQRAQSKKLVKGTKSGRVQWFMPITLVIQEAEIRRISIPGQPGQKVHKTPISINDWAWWCMPIIPAMQRGTNRRILVQASPGINLRSYLKNNQCEKG
jgi:hypothetical protein